MITRTSPICHAGAAGDDFASTDYSRADYSNLQFRVESNSQVRNRLVASGIWLAMRASEISPSYARVTATASASGSEQIQKFVLNGSKDRQEKVEFGRITHSDTGLLARLS